MCLFQPHTWAPQETGGSFLTPTYHLLRNADPRPAHPRSPPNCLAHLPFWPKPRTQPPFLPGTAVNYKPLAREPSVPPARPLGPCGEAFAPQRRLSLLPRTARSTCWRRDVSKATALRPPARSPRARTPGLPPLTHLTWSPAQSPGGLRRGSGLWDKKYMHWSQPRFCEHEVSDPTSDTESPNPLPLPR